jgi:hypothetical protein
LNGCSLFDQEEPIPSYLYITEMTLNTNPLVQGSGKHDIKDAWISVNGQFIGVFPLPALVPVLETGVQEVDILPGIAISGISNFRIVNPLYKIYEKDIDLKAGEVDTVQPIITYKDDVVFLLAEDFETSNLMTQEIDGNQDTRVTARSTGAFEGSKSGEIVLDATNNFIEVGSNLLYTIPETQTVYLELHYKNDVEFQIGVIGYANNQVTQKQYISGAFPSDEWKKIYVDITNDVNLMKRDGSEEFRVGLRALTTSTETVYIYLDNIKLIYR